MSKPDLQEIRRALDLIVAPGGVVELRAFQMRDPSASRGYTRPCMVSGYYDDLDALAEDVMRLRPGQPASNPCVYITAQVVNPDLLARRYNRCAVIGKGDSTSDSHITARRWLLVDVDPVRPSGIGSSDEEHRAAHKRAQAIRRDLDRKGWPKPIYADSGNGAHLMYRVDLPADDSGLSEACLKALAAKYSDDAVKVDTVNANPSRIWKLYGTIARKGDATPDRPHRLARIIEAPTELVIVEKRQLFELARVELTAKRVEAESRRSRPSRGERFDVEAFVARHLPTASAPHTREGTKFWELRVCPMHPAHDDGSAYVGELANGAITAGCHHNSCAWGWSELREHFEPGYLDRREEYEDRQRRREVRDPMPPRRREERRAPVDKLSTTPVDNPVDNSASQATTQKSYPQPSTAVDRPPVVADPLDEVALPIVSERLKARRGSPRPTIANALEVLIRDPRVDGVFAWDEMSGTLRVRSAPPWQGSIYDPRPFHRERPITDEDITQCAAWIDRVYDFAPGVDPMVRALLAAARRHSYHPVRSWLESLPEQSADEGPDSKSLLNSWLTTYLGVPDSPYVRRVGRWWLISAVARALQPGCKADAALVLEGRQGAGKSSAIAALVPSREWLLDSEIDPARDAKDAYQAIRGRWIVELAELDGLSRRGEAAAIKRFITSSVDSYRPSYARFMVDVPRTCVFVGSVNERDYLRDPTGNRRFWPVACGEVADIDLEGLKAVREALWGEALACFRSEVVEVSRYAPTREEYDMLTEEQSARRMQDPLFETVARGLSGRTAVSMGEVMGDILEIPIQQRTHALSIRIGIILADLGWDRLRESGSARRRYYVAPKKREDGVAVEVRRCGMIIEETPGEEFGEVVEDDDGHWYD